VLCVGVRKISTSCVAWLDQATIQNFHGYIPVDERYNFYNLLIISRLAAQSATKKDKPRLSPRAPGLILVSKTSPSDVMAGRPQWYRGFVARA
jgi:hypothetical protein